MVESRRNIIISKDFLFFAEPMLFSESIPISLIYVFWNIPQLPTSSNRCTEYQHSWEDARCSHFLFRLRSCHCPVTNSQYIERNSSSNGAPQVRQTYAYTICHVLNVVVDLEGSIQQVNIKTCHFIQHWVLCTSVSQSNFLTFILMLSFHNL